ncbi:MAG: MaoC family dehydratase [Acidimicrobiia bacterium]|nr:MaoC family dehydratase [bacterium]MXW59905.1 MaoC family dehydratase [Acidimicrobiia bacterium]MCY3961858.1 MaoC family dehydratase [bacterium]MDE0237112.1 MaoC family dehydratase [bacterium]MDE0613209.1 MaoC family dehydratase [bacterium]
MGTVFATVDDLPAAVGQHLGWSDWMEITQERVNQFADATGDHQWIHIDPERAATESPYGATIAHGYLTLSLTNMFLPSLITVEQISMGINYGVNKVRFPAPVPVGSRVRVGAELSSVDEINGGVQAVITITVEVEGSPKPACVVESLTRYMR